MRLLTNIRYALRQLKSAPGFAATVLLTVALGVGATTAIFSLVDAVLLKSLPVTKPEQLVRIGNEEICCIDSGLQNNWALFSYAQYKLFKNNTAGFEELSAVQAGPRLVGVRRAGSGQRAESYSSEFVSGNYFGTFGIEAFVGRILTPHDDAKGSPLVAVMSFRAWQEKFGRDPSVIGSIFFVNSQPVTIVGVAPPKFFGDRIVGNPPALWLPLASEPVLEPTLAFMNEPSWNWLQLIGRVSPETNRASLEAHLQVELRQFLQSPESKIDAASISQIPRQTLHLSPGGGGIQTLQNEYKNGLRLLMLASAFVLLIACANLANLMLVRATARGLQNSIRTALGASRSKLVSQALTESIVLAVIGGIAGVVLAYTATHLILTLAFGRQYVPIDAKPSLTILAFALGASLFTGITFGIVPAWMTTKADPIDALRGANRSTGRSTARGQRLLVITQAAISLVLLCAAGLLIRSLGNIRNNDFGFVTRNRYIAHIDPQMAGYKPDQLVSLYRQLDDGIRTLPDIESWSYSLYSPMDGDNWDENVYVNGQAPPPPGARPPAATWVRVSPRYFDAIGTKMVQGRPINAQDTPATRTVAVVNQLFVKTFLEDRDAIGKRFSNNKDHTGAFEIVGVTQDTNYLGPLSKMQPMYFLAQGQSAHIDEPLYRRFEDSTEYLNAIELKTRGDSSGLEMRLRRVLSGISPNLTLVDFKSFSEQVDTNLAQETMIVKLTSLFGLLALLLAAIGLYGVTAYTVQRRTREIGVRMAVGANRLDIVFYILGGAFLQVGIGLLIGLPLTLLSGRLLASQLFGVTVRDPIVLGGTLGVLMAVTFIAAIVPAWRAAITQPVLALRTE